MYMTIKFQSSALMNSKWSCDPSRDALGSRVPRTPAMHLELMNEYWIRTPRGSAVEIGLVYVHVGSLHYKMADPSLGFGIPLFEHSIRPCPPLLLSSLSSSSALVPALLLSDVSSRIQYWHSCNQPIREYRWWTYVFFVLVAPSLLLISLYAHSFCRNKSIRITRISQIWWYWVSRHKAFYTCRDLTWNTCREHGRTLDN